MGEERRAIQAQSQGSKTFSDLHLLLRHRLEGEKLKFVFLICPVKELFLTPCEYQFKLLAQIKIDDVSEVLHVLQKVIQKQ